MLIFVAGTTRTEPVLPKKKNKSHTSKALLQEEAVLVSSDVRPLYTNIRQKESVLFVKDEEHHQSKPPIPTPFLGDPYDTDLKENSFKLKDKHFLQAQGTAMGTKMAVVFCNFMAQMEKHLVKPEPSQTYR